ncbi:MAG: hypothetical protein RR069_05415, partial [Oscillospiraceae bacterium]
TTKSIIKSRKMLYADLKEIEQKMPEKLRLYESNTNFLFVKTNDATKIFGYLKSQGIIVRNMNGYLRITAGTEFENQQVIKNLKKFYKVG